MLKQRIIFGALGVILAIAVLTFCPVYIIGICLGAITVTGVCEFYKVTGISKKTSLIISGIIFSIANVVLVIFKSHESLSYTGTILVAFVFLLRRM